MGTRFLLGVALIAAPGTLGASDPKPVHVLRPRAEVTWVAFTPDSKHLLTGDRGSPRVGDENKYELRLWSIETGNLAAGPVAGAGVGASGAISPDGRSAVTGGTAGEWRLWTLPGLEPTARGRVGDGRVHRVAFRPDGRAFAALLARYGNEGAVRYTAFAVEAKTGRPIGKPVDWPAERPGGAPNRADTGEPAGWTAGNDPPFDRDGVPVRPNGGAARPLEVPGDGENCGGPMTAVISRDRKWAVSAGCNGQVVLWDYPARKVVGQPIAAYPGLAIRDPGLALSADGRRVAVASIAEHSVKGHLLKLTVYDLGTRKAVVGPLDLGALGVGLVSALAFSPDGSVLAIAFSRHGNDANQPTSEIQLWSMPAPK